MEKIYKQLVKYDSRKYLGFSENENPIFVYLEEDKILLIEKSHIRKEIFKTTSDNTVFITSNKTGKIYFISLYDYLLKIFVFNFNGVSDSTYIHNIPYKKEDVVLLDVLIEENQDINLIIEVFEEFTNLKFNATFLTISNCTGNIIYLNHEEQIMIEKIDKTPLSPEYYYSNRKGRNKIVGRPTFYNSKILVNVIDKEIGSLIEIIDIKNFEKISSIDFVYTVIDATIVENIIYCIINYNGIQRIKAYNVHTGFYLKEESMSLEYITGSLEFSLKNEEFVCLEQRSLYKGINYYEIKKDTYKHINSNIKKDNKIIIDNTETKFIKTLTFLPSDGYIKKIIIALHGGPESCEWDELRYWGLYRELIDKNIGIVALNYAGSINFGLKHQQKPWKNWYETFNEEFSFLLDYLKNYTGINENDVIVLGGSFGAALALQTGIINKNIAGIIAIAPLIELSSQVEKVKDDTNYYEWFNTRFDLSNKSKDLYFFSKSFYLKNEKVPVALIQGTHDEILDFNETKTLFDLAVSRGLKWSFLIEDRATHHPIDTEHILRRINNIKKAINIILESNPLKKEDFKFEGV